MDMNDASICKQPQKHIALYGPPGAGKSTVILAAINAGWQALDLEDAGSTFEERRAIIKSFADGEKPWTLFGAADLTPELFPLGTKFVLLLPDEEVLVKRVEARNDQRVHKWVKNAKKVREEHALMAKQNVFDLVITEDTSPEEILMKLSDR